MPKQINIMVIVLSLILGLFSLSFSQESMTITTYYPSPYGSYRELRAQRMAIGDNYYGPAYCWPPDICTNQIDANADLVVEGNVGIGTPGPTSRLHVDVTNLSGNPILFAMSDIQTDASSWYFAPARCSGCYAPGATAGDLVLRSSQADDNFLITTDNGAATTLAVTSGGNVGIGTTNPGAKLEIGASGNLLLKASAGDPGDIIFQNSAGIQKARIWSDPTAGVNKLHLSSADNTPDITIDAAGRVGIGTPGPASKLEINYGGRLCLGDVGHGTNWPGLANCSQMSTSGYALIQEPSGAYTLINKNSASGYIGFRVANVDKMVINQNGNVGIGTATPDPANKLDVNGDVIANNYHCRSDINLKENIQSIGSKSALEKILKLRGVTFNWKEGEDKKNHLGLISQEVEAVFPELVSTNPQDNMKSLEYQSLIAPLIEAIKEQQNEITELKKAIAELKQN